ncbi:putative ribosome control protein [Acrodontium crateriforme]|uniref:Ribosome control protein n=1 Tax=Acrodontium crateriforme TaxID=150365 RepID=A0AAQ3M1F6_9PEZI|nr:putative ribosome control protein [Acrodontium crateriforme]
MYWPIGSPNAYSLTKLRETTRTSQSQDGIQEETTVAETGENNTESSVSKDNASDGIITVASSGREPDLLQSHDEILAMKVSRGGNIFATITTSRLTVWQQRPLVALASVVRSSRSMELYGPNTALLLRPDALIIVVQTSLGNLITYSLTSDQNARVYRTRLANTTRHARKDSADGYNNFRRPSTAPFNGGVGDGDGIREVSLRFRMVIRIDAGISKSLAVDDELVVATQKPSALQCIRWVNENGNAQTSSELLSRLPWLAKGSTITEIVHDRPMNLTCWITNDGRAYAVQRRQASSSTEAKAGGMYQGFCFRDPETNDSMALKVAINARFSLIAVGCSNGRIDVFIVKDYTGNIPISHTVSLQVSSETSGKLSVLSYSPDGYCLFAGFEKGWAMWSVYGKPGATSFGVPRGPAEANDEPWLFGIRDAFWIGGGCELALLGYNDDRLWTLGLARNAATGCLSSTNLSRGLLYSSDSIITYKGHDVSDITALPSDASLWQSVQLPAPYLRKQWPIKSAVVSNDGRYVAVAGRRGLAHYSVLSGRWKIFDDPEAENEFAVRGGMCWHQHFLIAAVETGTRYQVRVYSREKNLDYSHVQHTEELSAPAILTTTSGMDSLLVYTHDNTLQHYIITATSNSVKLLQVGQIGFHGIIRAPPRVRAISWILPDDQLEHGDPSQDVATASVIFLVDGKLVLLQPSTNEQGELKYDMRVIAHNVEYYILLRDQPAALELLSTGAPESQSNSLLPHDHLGHSLRDSLWYFDGDAFHVWSDVQDVMACAPVDLGRDLPPSVQVPVDFYPISAVIAKGIIHGCDVDLVQRRDVNFSFFRQVTRTELFLPQLLRHHLAEYNSPAALHLAHSYQHLPYFSHALEVLLHDVLDNEVDNPPSPSETALLPTVVAFLSSFPSYLDIIVNCTRKTELRSWQTLFSHLPPVIELFEQALDLDKLKTAAGYLLVLHTFEQDSFQVHEFARLLKRASAADDWELCRELARFLVGIDTSGQTLGAAMREAGLKDRPNGTGSGHLTNGNPTKMPSGPDRVSNSQSQADAQHEQDSQLINGLSSPESRVDYFSIR